MTQMAHYWIVEYKRENWWRAVRRGSPFETRREARHYRDFLKRRNPDESYRVEKFLRDHWARMSGLGKA